MNADLTADQPAFVLQAIREWPVSEDAVQEALSLWQERAEILAAVDSAEASRAHGEGRSVTQQSMRKLANDIKQHGRLRRSLHRCI